MSVSAKLFMKLVSKNCTDKATISTICASVNPAWQHGCKLRVGDPAERLDQPLCEADRRVASRVGGAPPAVEGNLFL
jgi:hypothetical protein